MASHSPTPSLSDGAYDPYYVAVMRCIVYAMRLPLARCEWRFPPESLDLGFFSKAGGVRLCMRVCS